MFHIRQTMPRCVTRQLRTSTLANHRMYSILSGFETLRVRDVKLKQNADKRSQWTIEETSSVFDATKKMVDNRTGSLCVTRNGQVVGIVTERDYLRKIVHQGKRSQTTSVSEICTTSDHLVLASEDDTIQDCVDVMAGQDIRNLPVKCASGEVVGLLSIKDIARALSNERENVISKLANMKLEQSMPIHDG